jgi:predicted TPR repeat methyltransferase
MASRAVELTPRWDVAQWNLAQRAVEADDTETAQQAVTQVLEIAPDHAGARALLAELDRPARQ